MASVGEFLRERRERRGLSLEEISRVTRVASRYLEALEADRFIDLPAPVFTRGFIRAYCQALAEPPDEALARFDGRDGAPVVIRTVPVPPPHPAEPEPRSRSAVLVSFILLVILGMALFAVALMTQPAREERAERRPALDGERAASPPAAPATPVAPAPEPAPTAAAARPPAAPAPSPVVAVAPQAPAAPPLPAAPPVPATPPAPPAAPATVGVTTDTARPPAAQPWLGEMQAATGGVLSPYRLVARVTEPTWIRVRTDDGRTTEETVQAGQVREWVSNRPFVVTLGNAGGVKLELNGRPLPPLGPSGTVIGRLVLPPQ